MRSFQWWWRCSDRRLGAKIPMKAVSLLAMYSTFDGSGHTGILTTAAEQYQRWLRQRKNTRKDEDLYIRIMNNSLYIEENNTIQ